MSQNPTEWKKLDAMCRIPSEGFDETARATGMLARRALEIADASSEKALRSA